MDQFKILTEFYFFIFGALTFDQLDLCLQFSRSTARIFSLPLFSFFFDLTYYSNLDFWIISGEGIWVLVVRLSVYLLVYPKRNHYCIGKNIVKKVSLGLFWKKHQKFWIFPARKVQQRLKLNLKLFSEFKVLLSAYWTQINNKNTNSNF